MDVFNSHVATWSKSLNIKLQTFFRVNFILHLQWKFFDMHLLPAKDKGFLWNGSPNTRLSYCVCVHCSLFRVMFKSSNILLLYILLIIFRNMTVGSIFKWKSCFFFILVPLQTQSIQINLNFKLFMSWHQLWLRKKHFALKTLETFILLFRSHFYSIFRTIIDKSLVPHFLKHTVPLNQVIHRWSGGTV